MFGAEVTQEVEIATIERPHRLRLLVDHPDLHASRSASSRSIHERTAPLRITSPPFASTWLGRRRA
jgi:hypothetical protein